MATLDLADVRLALIQAEGNLSYAAARCNVSRTMLVNFIDATPSLKALIADLEEEFNDDAESAFAETVAAGEKWAVCQY